MRDNNPLRDELMKAGIMFLRNHGFPIAAPLSDFGIGEPDIIGFSHELSAVVDIRTKRSDFLRRRLALRDTPDTALGNVRFFLTPMRMVRRDELPEGWLLLEYTGATIIPYDFRQENHIGVVLDSHPEWRHESDATAERDILYSIANRLTEKEDI